MRQGRDRLIEQAVAAGYNRDEVTKYIDTLLTVPKDVPTELDLDTTQADRDLANFLANARNQQIRIQARVDADPNYNPASAPSQIRRARGGIIPGMPSSSDNLRADVASGEYLVNADATAKNRELLDAINQGRQPAPQAVQTYAAQPVQAGPLVGTLIVKDERTAIDELERMQRRQLTQQRITGVLR